MIYLLALVAGGLAEYWSEKWTIRWNTAVQARSYPLGRNNMQRHVRRVILLGWGLLALGAVDVASIFGGAGLFVSVYLGSMLGSAIATHRELWRKWHKKVQSLQDDDEET